MISSDVLFLGVVVVAGMGVLSGMDPCGAGE
jgi:hypothetical protein